MISRVFAHSTVTDLVRAEDWYGRLFGRAPDATPMPGLLEWYLTDAIGVQVWSEPDRGPLLDGAKGDRPRRCPARLVDVAIAIGGPAPGGGARILMLTDPDGNRVVLAGTRPHACWPPPHREETSTSSHDMRHFIRTTTSATCPTAVG